MVKSSSPSAFTKVDLIAMVKVMITCQKVEADLNVHESSDQLSVAYVHRVPRSIYDDDADRS